MSVDVNEGLNGIQRELATHEGPDVTFYGFLGGETHQWEPTLYAGTTPVHRGEGRDGRDYHLTEDLVDRSIAWVRPFYALAR